MANEPKYSSIIDEFLDSREPDWKALGLKDAKDGGDTWLDHTRDEADLDFLDDLAEGASKHTAVPPNSKGATLRNRLLDQANASSRMGSAQPANTRNAAVISKSEKDVVSDDQGLLDDITMSFEQAEKSSTVEKKDCSEAEIKKFVKHLLNQGETPNKVAAALNKLAEATSFNMKAATDYLRKNAGMIGLAYLEPAKTAEIELFQKSMSNNYLNGSDSGGTGMEVLSPNTFMDKQNPAYGHKANKQGGGHPLLNSIHEQKMEGLPDIIKSISVGDRVTIRTPQGQERTGRAVMLSSHGGWVLNMGGKHGTPGLADEDNIVRVSKKKSAGDDTVNELVKRIQNKIRELKSEGTVGMSRGNLKQVIDTRGLNFANPHHFTQSFDEAIRRVFSDDTSWLDGDIAEQKKNFEDAGVSPDMFSDAADYSEEDEVHDRHHASGADCIRQHKAWKAAGITPRAKSVKQITACQDCSYFKKNAGTKSCGLYGLPVVGSSAELAAVVNRMTAGVPSKSKHAALVQIANRLPEQSIPNKTASQESPFQRQSTFTHERDYGFKEAAHFSGNMVQKLHAAGHSLKVIQTAAEKKFGSLESSKGIREFIASLSKEKGKIIMAKADADYLKKMGIHNEAVVGAAKCASCKAHIGKETHKAASSELITRAPEKFVETTLGSLRSEQKKSSAHFDSAKVAKLHDSGLTLKVILKEASKRFGSAQASKAVRDWAHNLKNTNTKIALSQVDCTVLHKMGVKLSPKNAIIGAAKCGSCSYRNGMACGLTGGTLLSFPGLSQIASNKKVAAGAPEDGRSMLNEYDLVNSSAQADIDMKEPDRAEIQMSATMDAGEI